MSSTVTSRTRPSHDHFEPQDIDPQGQRRLRGHLEQIDYAAYASNQAVIGQVLEGVDTGQFQRMAVSAAQARARWVAAALKATEGSAVLSAAQTADLAHLRAAYQETAEAYDALRRMVERGYLTYRPSKA